MKRLLVVAWRHAPPFLLVSFYRWTAGVVTVALGRRDRVSVYAKGSFALKRIAPGLSDIDLVVVVDDRTPRPTAPADVRRRWQRLRTAFPPARALVDVSVMRRPDLLVAMRGPTQVFGLDDAAGAAAHQGSQKVPLDPLVRPGLYGPTADWRLLRGRELRPTPALGRPWPEQIDWIAAWLELQHWWRHVPRLVAQPDGPRAAYLSLRLVVESARVWLWTVHGVAAGDREDVLAQARARRPDDPALDLAARLAARPGTAVPIDRAVVLAWLFERTTEVAVDLTARAGHHPATPVALLGDRRSDDRRPLLDWRALVLPSAPVETVTVAHGHPAEPAAISAATAAGEPGAYVALRHGPVVTMPAAGFGPALLRSVQFPISDPVTFAVLDDAASASFPDIAGRSAGDVATRAVHEHASITTTPPLGFEAQGGVRLLTAARAALFSESVRAGHPELCLNHRATLDQLAEQHGHRWLLDLDPEDVLGPKATPPRPTTSGVQELHAIVTALPPYRDRR